MWKKKVRYGRIHKDLRPHVGSIDFSSYKSVAFIIVILFYFVKKLLFKYKIPVIVSLLGYKSNVSYHAIVSVDLQTFLMQAQRLIKGHSLSLPVRCLYKTESKRKFSNVCHIMLHYINDLPLKHIYF
jgi:hypothetical protein